MTLKKWLSRSFTQRIRAMSRMSPALWIGCCNSMRRVECFSPSALGVRQEATSTPTLSSLFYVRSLSDITFPKILLGIPLLSQGTGTCCIPRRATCSSAGSRPRVRVPPPHTFLPSVSAVLSLVTLKLSSVFSSRHSAVGSQRLYSS